MPKFKIHGYLYEPSCDGADRDGYIHFYEVIDAPTEAEAREIAYEDYGEYNTLEMHGVAATEADGKAWLDKNEQP